MDHMAISSLNINFDKRQKAAIENIEVRLTLDKLNILNETIPHLPCMERIVHCHFRDFKMRT